MKRSNKIFFLLLLFAPFFFSCERDLESEGISRITQYATFNLEGDEVISIGPNDSYSEPGITATEGGASIPVSTSISYSPLVLSGDGPSDAVPRSVSAVDPANPGMYTVTYSATNSDGYSATTQRLVFVHDATPDATVNLSGNYTSGTSPAAVITKVADGLFFSTNTWGGGSTVRIPAYIMTSDGVTLSVPQQASTDNIYGFGTKAADGTLNMKMSRPTFPASAGGPLLDLTKNWVKQ